MALDHYVPQVHLKKFYSPALGPRMHALRKSNLKHFTPDAKSVCRIEDGSTNEYLSEPRAIEDFLAVIEPKYSAALTSVACMTKDSDVRDSVLTISGFVASVFCCSPTGMRVLVEPLKSLVETTTAIMDKRGLLPTPPPGLGGSNATELLRSGKLVISIDPRFSQSMVIAQILEHTKRFGNSWWDLLHNDWADVPFCTSDFPVCVEETGHPQIINRIVPLSPTLAIRIRSDPEFDASKDGELSFPNFRFRHRTVSRQDAIDLNRLIVRCAEDVVFYRDELPWVRQMVEENRHYRLEVEVQRLGPAHLFRQRVVDKSRREASKPTT